MIPNDHMMLRTTMLRTAAVLRGKIATLMEIEERLESGAPSPGKEWQQAIADLHTKYKRDLAATEHAARGALPTPVWISFINDGVVGVSTTKEDANKDAVGRAQKYIRNGALPHQVNPNVRGPFGLDEETE